MQMTDCVGNARPRPVGGLKQIDDAFAILKHFDRFRRQVQAARQDTPRFQSLNRQTSTRPSSSRVVDFRATTPVPHRQNQIVTQRHRP